MNEKRKKTVEQCQPVTPSHGLGNEENMRMAIMDVLRQMRDEMADLKASCPQTVHALRWYTELLEKAIHAPPNPGKYGRFGTEEEAQKAYDEWRHDHCYSSNCDSECPFLDVTNRCNRSLGTWLFAQSSRQNGGQP